MPFRQVTVTDKVTQIWPYNPRRVAGAIVNEAGATVYLSNNRQRITEEGFPRTVGDEITFSKDRFDNVEEELNAQCLPGMSADLRVYESFASE